MNLLIRNASNKGDNLAVTNCDLLIFVGTRCSDRASCKVDGLVPDVKIIQVDIDTEEINKTLELVNLP